MVNMRSFLVLVL
jgi:hypothetical protein